VRPFRLKKFFASKRIVSEQRSVSHEIRLFTSSIRFPFFAFFAYFRFNFFATIRFKHSCIREFTSTSLQLVPKSFPNLILFLYRRREIIVRGQSLAGVFRNIDPPSPSPPGDCVQVYRSRLYNAVARPALQVSQGLACII
jgi:hypothetical protein